MGKGRIIAEHGAGFYTIELIEDRLRAEVARTNAVQRIDAIDARIAELEADESQQQLKVNAAADDLNLAIIAYQQEPTAENLDATKELSEALVNASAKRDAIAGNIASLKLERLALQRRIDRIDALPALRQQQAWCADLTEELTGEVGTAEVPNAPNQVLIHPGHEGAAAYDVVRDGALQPALSGTPASVFYNLAMFPGWQKWRPTYRMAEITSLSTAADTCSITLDPATSSEQSLNVNAQASYADVPIQYMTCHANAFEVGDRVLVRFDRLDQSPTVIGFESEPRGCGIDTVVAMPVTLHYNDSFPFLIGGPCGCNETIPTPGMIYSERNVIDYIWSIGFSGAFGADVTVFYEGKMKQVLDAADYTGWPAPDEIVTEPEDTLISFHRTPPRYPYQFPTNQNQSAPDGCGYQGDNFSRVAVTDDTPWGGGEKFFGGDLVLHDPGTGVYENLNIDGTNYQYTTTPYLRQYEWESLEHGVYTVANDGAGSCTALYLLSKDKQQDYIAAPYFSLGIGEFGSQRRLPWLTINGKRKRPLGVFGMVGGENEWNTDTAYFNTGFAREYFNLRHERKYYLLVGYGR